MSGVHSLTAFPEYDHLTESYSMNHRFTFQAPPFHANAITETIEIALTAAGLQTKTGLVHGVTETIRQAFASAGLHAGSASSPDDSVIDVVAREVRGTPEQTIIPCDSSLPNAPDASGQFVTRKFSNRAGARTYKLYVPSRRSAATMPLIVMLHGCTQSADDFAVGTRMNRLAEQHGFLVAYPQQAVNANGSKCWNWFKSLDQLRDSGEPSLIAGITREIVANHPVDQSRIFVAGLSAGAAMAVILGETYPELYAAVGAHSGLPFGAAHDMPSAFAAMRGGRHATHDSSKPRAAVGSQKKAAQFVPTIVFHGDRDQTVSQSNGAEIIRQAGNAFVAKAGEPGLPATTEIGHSPHGRGYRRTVHSDTTGRALIESWMLDGAGHAWSGGDASGSFTDPKGPDASVEMVRFFLAQRAQ